MFKAAAVHKRGILHIGDKLEEELDGLVSSMNMNVKVVTSDFSETVKDGVAMLPFSVWIRVLLSRGICAE